LAGLATCGGALGTRTLAGIEIVASSAGVALGNVCVTALAAAALAFLAGLGEHVESEAGGARVARGGPGKAGGAVALVAFLAARIGTMSYDMCLIGHGSPTTRARK